MEKNLIFIFNEKEFTQKQAEKVKETITALSRNEDYINFNEFSEGTAELFYRWEYANGNVYMLDTDTSSYLRIAELPPTTRFEYDDYGKVRKEYLKSEYPITFEALEAANKLETHIAYLDRLCNEAEEELMTKMSKSEGITEELKDTNMLEWVGRRKNLRSRVREIVLEDMVYTAYFDNTSEEEQNG